MRGLLQSSVEYSHRIQTEVLGPIRRWRDRLRTAEGRYKEVEGARVELDYWRRQVEGLSATVEGQRAHLTHAMSVRSQNRIEKNTRALQDKEAQVESERPPPCPASAVPRRPP
jgi:hypothetical protein